jgi:hypothetical protein
VGIAEHVAQKRSVYSMNRIDLKKLLGSKLWGKRLCGSCSKAIDSQSHFYSVLENNWNTSGKKRIIKNFCEICANKKGIGNDA